MSYTKSFNDFLKKDREKRGTYEVVISDRLKEFPFKIKPMKFNEYSNYQSEASKLKVKSKDASFDTNKFYMSMILNHVIEPNFKDIEMIKDAGYVTAESYVLGELYIDEITNLGNAIMEISGVNTDFESIINEAKNS